MKCKELKYLLDMKRLILFILPFVLCGCLFTYDPPQKGIEVRNNTDSAIYVYYSFTDSIELTRRLVLFENWKHIGINELVTPNYRVDAYNSRGIGTTGRESLVNQSNDKKLRLFFIKEETMRTKTWERICEGQIYAKKKTLTVKDLEKTNWIVKYP